MGGVTRAVSSVFGGSAKSSAADNIVVRTLDPDGAQRRKFAQVPADQKGVYRRSLFARNNKGFGFSLGDTSEDIREQLLG